MFTLGKMERSTFWETGGRETYLGGRTPPVLALGSSATLQASVRGRALSLLHVEVKIVSVRTGSESRLPESKYCWCRQEHHAHKILDIMMARQHGSH